jgi:Kef-type K+ transport system membrane component KefB
MAGLSLLILQVLVILITARAAGWLFGKLHQPPVIGEMAAGILLGPSLLGWLAPDVSARLFPLDSLGVLSALSQIGLLLYMFLVGLELEPQTLRGQGHAAIVTSHASILMPFFLGTALALLLYPLLSDNGTAFTGFALFMGVAMSITAFPVLARILADRGLLRTRLGALAIACAAVDDVTGWCILAVVVVIIRAEPGVLTVGSMLLGLAVYLALMWFVARRLLRGLEVSYLRQGRLTLSILALALIVALGSGWMTEELGVHALFGAFVAGVVMPKHPGLVRQLTDKLESVLVVLLLPLFFAFTGLRTSIQLLDSPQTWLYCGLIILVATVGKFGGTAVAARLSGVAWREAAGLGVLMNTRGLIELVVLNIGLDIGVLSPALFAMMVVMALVTTFATSPVLAWMGLGHPGPAVTVAEIPPDTAPQGPH